MGVDDHIRRLRKGHVAMRQQLSSRMFLLPPRRGQQCGEAPLPPALALRVWLGDVACG